MPTATFDQSGYIVAPLAAPIAYATIMPLWDVPHFGINPFLFVLLFIQSITVVSVAVASLIISIPLLWLFRNMAEQLILPRKLFIVLAIVLAFLFSWLSFVFQFKGFHTFADAMICGVALNFLIFTRHF